MWLIRHCKDSNWTGWRLECCEVPGAVTMHQEASGASETPLATNRSSAAGTCHEMQWFQVNRDYSIQSKSLLDFLEQDRVIATVFSGDFPIFVKLIRAAAANVFRRGAQDMRRTRTGCRRVRF